MPDSYDINVAQVNQPAEMGDGSSDAVPAFILGTLRRRWLMMLLTTLGVAAVSVSAIWVYLAPEYEVSALVHIAPVVRPILFADAESDISRQYRAYVSTEAQAMVSPAVIQATLNKPEVRSLPSIVHSPNAEEELVKRLEIELVKNTYTLSVSMVGEAPEEMAIIINSLLDVYLRQRETKKRQWDEKILGSLRSVQVDLEAQLEAKNAELRELPAIHGMGSPDGPEATINARIVDLHQRLTEIRQKNALATARLKTLDTEDNTDSLLELIPDGFEHFRQQDPERQRILERISSYEDSGLDDVRLERGAKHPAIRNRIEHIKSLQADLNKREAKLPQLYKDHVRRQLERERSETEITAKALQARLDKLMEERVSVARQAFMVDTVRHEQERLELGLTQVRQKIWNVQVEQNRLARVTIDLPAVAPDAPNIDKRLKFTGVACLMSLFFSVGVALLREKMDTRVREPSEVSRQLGLPLLGCLQRLPDTNGAGLLCDDRVLEPMRGISTALLSSRRTEPTRSRLVTSPTAGCGKSSLAMNLARSLASTGRRVLLVDADNRGQGVTRANDMTGQPGLLEYLDNTCTTEEVIHTIAPNNLRILPAGKSDERFGEILSRRHVRDLLSSLFEDYDEVIVDSPPVLPCSDAIVLATIVDDIILVLRAGKSTRQEAHFARESLATIGDKPVAVILNAIDPHSSPYYAGGAYAYAESTTENKSSS